MTDDADRAARAFEDVVAVERVAPGMVEVVTWSDAYTVDARDAGCNCPDKQYRGVATCKHDLAALAADTDDLPAPGIVADDLSHRTVADGGERPDDCECDGWRDELGLPCWPCHVAGFDTPHPDADDDDAPADDDTGREEPTRSEPADFGHGESTGVQDL